MKKVNKLVLLLIIILGICIVDFVIINDKDSEKAEPEKSEVESVEQVGNNVETEDFSVSFEADGEETAKESNTATSSTSEGIKKITSWDFENAQHLLQFLHALRQEFKSWVLLSCQPASSAL
jgi:hypothetical protein